MNEYHEERRDEELIEKLREFPNDGAEEIQDEEPARDVAGNHEAQPATEDEAADKVKTVWRPSFEEDPAGTLDDLRARVKELGYELAYAGRTFRAPVTERTYFIMDPVEREPIDVFHCGDADLTLLDVCLWSELALKKWMTP